MQINQSLKSSTTSAAPAGHDMGCLGCEGCAGICRAVIELMSVPSVVLDKRDRNMFQTIKG